MNISSLSAAPPVLTLALTATNSGASSSSWKSVQRAVGDAAT